MNIRTHASIRALFALATLLALPLMLPLGARAQQPEVAPEAQPGVGAEPQLDDTASAEHDAASEEHATEASIGDHEAELAPEATEEHGEREWPQRLGPVEAVGEHGTVGVGFGTQIRGTATFEDGESDGVFQLHRARLFLRASFLDGRVRFKLQTDFAPRAFELIDLYVEGDITERVALRAGIGKIPFTEHWMQSFLRLSVVDWPLTERWFGGGRQVGLTLFDPRKDAPWTWAVGVYQGQTLRPANGQRFVTAYGDDRVNYLDLQEFRPLATPHPELAGRVTRRGSAGAVDGLVSLSAAWDTRPEHGVDETLRLALDGRLRVGPLTAWAGAFLAAAEELDGDLMLSHGGSLLEAEVRPHPLIGVALRHSAVIRSDALRRDARATADERIATASDPDRQAELEGRYAGVDRIRAQHETVFGVNVYFVGHDLKWQTDVSWLRDAGPDRDQWRLRSHINLAF